MYVLNSKKNKNHIVFEYGFEKKEKISVLFEKVNTKENRDKHTLSGKINITR